MLTALVLSLREGLEAALLIGIVLGAVKKSRRDDLAVPAWLGALVAGILSLAIAFALQYFDASLAEDAEPIFEGLAMLLAAGVLTWMFFWMRRQSKGIKSEIESGVSAAIKGSGRRGVFLLSFSAVIREGVELALFVGAAGLAASQSQAFIGAALGIGIAAALGWALLASLVRLDLQHFFQVTSFFLIIFAAGLVTHGIGELTEAGLAPSIIAHLWDSSFLLSDNSFLGQIAGSLLGYSSAPSLVQVIAYIGYIAGLLAALKLGSQPGAPITIKSKS